MSKKKHKNKNNKTPELEKIFLETSAQISRMSSNPKGDKVRRLVSTHRLYSSYFVLYEFKTGLLRSLIEFYFIVKIDGPAKALAIWSDKFSIRDQKNIILLQSYLLQVNDSISGSNTQDYLNKIEAIIFQLINNFDTDLVGMVGDFGSDEIVRTTILTSADYDSFIKSYKDRPCIPMDGFWLNHKEQLQALVNAKKEMSASTGLKKILAHLEKIDADIQNANKHHTNKAVGDSIIAIEMPNSMKLASFDHSFGALCPLLKKEYFQLT